MTQNSYSYNSPFKYLNLLNCLQVSNFHLKSSDGNLRDASYVSLVMWMGDSFEKSSMIIKFSKTLFEGHQVTWHETSWTKHEVSTIKKFYKTQFEGRQEIGRLLAAAD